MPEVGLETAFQPLKTLGTREKMRNPVQSEGWLAQYETKSVDIVHTPFYPLSEQLCPANFERTDIPDSREPGRYVPPPSPFYLLRD